MKEKKYIVFHIEGGLGKHVAATAVAKALVKNNPERDLIIVCAYPDLFANLDFVHKVFRLGVTPYFYYDYIKDKDTLVFKHDPYNTTSHIIDRENLIKTWIEMYGYEYKNESPEIKLNISYKDYSYDVWKRDKPVLLLHTNGGLIGREGFKYSWTRDLPKYVGQKIVDKYKEDYHIIQVCHDKANALQGVEVLHEKIPNMELFGLVAVSSKRIFIDSSLQHAAIALGLKSNVIWIGTHPSIFGYKQNNNIVAKLENHMNPNAYLYEYDFNGSLFEMPNNKNLLFNADNVLSKLKI